MKKGNGLAVVLIVVGALLLFGKLGSFLGSLIGFLLGLLIPVLVIALGVMAWRRGNKVVGGVLGVIGALMLLGRLSTVIFWVAAIAIIVYGVSMLKSRNRY
ncbi:LiaF transmembrane domain-containing protein [Cohnella fermenti]|uniref:LiaF transmembrane domain-containing protein n=1 Tax=Cohnella fermenti TaxID=2565925 RepID=A0A4S4C4S5_9BACL|nr:hypothetical protein [Cohnella fermenti]THF82754.1 hypothetical protein E6C55_06750 [Cohnella fermenti]